MHTSTGLDTLYVTCYMGFCTLRRTEMDPKKKKKNSIAHVQLQLCSTLDIDFSRIGLPGVRADTSLFIPWL